MPAPLTIGVCGAGAMGSGIALVAAQSGASVVVFDVSEASRAKSHEATAKNLDQSVEKGRISAEDAVAFLKAMRWTADLPDLANCDLVIEAIVEDIEIKRKLFSDLEAVLTNEAIIASNTSSLSIAKLAKSLKRPDRFAGMHFFNPANVMKLVEVIAGPATADEVVERIVSIASSWKKVPVKVADVPGFIVNRVARPYYAEAFDALQQSAASPLVIDHLFKASAGFKMGPLELTDLIGQDINFSVARSVYDAYFGHTRFTPQLLQGSLVDAGWLGRKTGRGVYDYADAANRPKPVPTTSEPRTDVPAKPEAPGPEAGRWEIEGVLVMFTSGRTAKAVAQAEGRPVVLLDWFDPAVGTACGFAASDDEAARVGAGVINAWGLEPFRIADRPGLIVTRTLAQIANAAGDAVHEGVSDEEGIDSALRFGANYPFGPVAWTKRVGPESLVTALRAISATTGKAMYNPSEYWTSRS